MHAMHVLTVPEMEQDSVDYNLYPAAKTGCEVYLSVYAVLRTTILVVLR
jgi:hypothetical protein